MIFTIAAIPLIGFVGAAIDYSRANAARSTMQAALDSTALMLSKDLSSNGKITRERTSRLRPRSISPRSTPTRTPRRPVTGITATYTGE